MRQEKRNSQTELVVINHIVNETIKFPDQTIEGVLGSPTAYSSVVASKLGVKTGMVTKIGEDMPKDLLQSIYEAGVDTRGIKHYFIPKKPLLFPFRISLEITSSELGEIK